ncbi:hypothetical protein EHQ27_03005 [Leptospira wolffii]|uniref:hypothetical protein n=1 Tax=Leptospira wolffii TaxID=409998 RepID=UPI0003454E52|nr:hypothetical protein [Leptospira wolffii]TGK64843.1 hypothetical protein EHQ32_01075 [Leptospira wolffii]TGK76758.1 hypothetical protein EHQ35_00140 [Leptospira wolffii]TGK77390.1 hypothetical protein EHQ27_03005 [Leptospira wolffii]TGL26785.1 hypothetical protein EHQ57_18910 [Leptospira wolffii]
MKRCLFAFAFLVVFFTNACGLYLGGTEAGRSFLGLGEDKKQDPAALASLLQVVSGGTLLVFSPSPLDLIPDVPGNYTASLASPAPVSWSSDEVNLSFDIDYSSCPSETSASPTVSFAPPSYSGQTLDITTHSNGNCALIFTVNQGTSVQSGISVGTFGGVLPVISAK